MPFFFFVIVTALSLQHDTTVLIAGSDDYVKLDSPNQYLGDNKAEVLKVLTVYRAQGNDANGT